MFEMTRDFGRKLRPGVVALFYYAGHGLQVRDRNFLIPVEADVQSEEEVPYTSVDVNYLLDVMNRAKSRINIVILDACRNNPFARSFRSGSSGLAQMDAPSGTLIAYATAPGRVASDGAGAHGLYTQHLLKHIATPGLPVEILFKRVREGVERETRSQQIPWESSSLKGDFFFTAAAPAAAPAPVVAAPAASDPAFTTELAFWDSIKTSQSAADYQAYLDTYPKGRFAALARARANSLKVAATPPSAPAAVAPQRPAQLAAVAPTTMASGKLPVSGERWVYRHTDEWTSRTTEITHETFFVHSARISEILTAIIASRHVRASIDVPLAAEISTWTLGPITMREFHPFALAVEPLRPGMVFTDVRGMPSEQHLPDWAGVTAKVVAEEEVAVPAGRFRALKVEITGHRPLPNRTTSDAGRFVMTVWYAPDLKRHVKLHFYSFAGSTRAAPGTVYTSPLHKDVYELVSAPR
jgi:hypothetical protein